MYKYDVIALTTDRDPMSAGCILKSFPPKLTSHRPTL